MKKKITEKKAAQRKEKLQQVKDFYIMCQEIDRLDARISTLTEENDQLRKDSN
jgi:hypothetical protein